jgi:hypothetical protein
MDLSPKKRYGLEEIPGTQNPVIIVRRKNSHPFIVLSPARKKNLDIRTRLSPSQVNKGKIHSLQLSSLPHGLSLYGKCNTLLKTLQKHPREDLRTIPKEKGNKNLPLAVLRGYNPIRGEKNEKSYALCSEYLSVL